MEGDIDLMPKEEIALRRDVKVIIDGLTGRLADVKK